MEQEQEHFCIDRFLPEELTAAGREAAIKENPENASPLSAFEAASVKSKLWKRGRTLRVCFLDGDPSVQAKVKTHAMTWTNHANIHFNFGNDPNSEIRISFLEKGSWSALGTDALVRQWFPLDGPTMNYGWLNASSTNEEIARVVLHEFGHALGMIHEHQNPAGGIQWNEAAVIASLSGPPNNWTPDQIRHNVLNRYSAAATQFTAFDPKSIMLYSFPKSWTLNGMTFALNSALSPTDIAFIKARYPK